MPVTFSSIPLFLQKQIIRKMNVKEVAALEQSSQTSSVVQRVKVLAPIAVRRVLLMNINGELYIRVNRQFTPKKLSEVSQIRFTAETVTIEDNLSPFLCGKVLEFVHRSQSTFTELNVNFWDAKGLTSPSSFSELLLAAGVKTLRIHGYANSQEFVKNVPDSVTKLSFNSKVGDEVLDGIKAPEVEIKGSVIDDIGLNNLLKEWFAGKRKIDHFLITTDKALLEEDVFDEVPYSTTFNKCLFKIYNGSEYLYVKINNKGHFEAANAIYKISNLR